MACYARQAKNKDLEADANEIRMRAERRLGEMMDEGKPDRAAVGGYRRNDGIPKTPSFLPTLIEVGIDKNLAKRARTLGRLSAEEFEEAVQKNRARIADEADRITRRTINVAARAERRLGAMMDEQPKSVGGRPITGFSKNPVKEGPPTLAEAGIDKNLEADANEIRMRAERRLGELMDEQKETFGLNKGGGIRSLITGISENPVIFRPSPRLASTRTWRTAPAHWGGYPTRSLKKPSKPKRLVFM
jgi:hypothetical protein